MPARKTFTLWSVTIIAVVCGGVFLANYQSDLPLVDLKRKYANAESEYVDVLGMPVHYRDEGSGPVLLLLHGTGASLHTWDGWIEPLQRDFRIVRLDLPGFGLTGPDPGGEYTVAGYVAFLRAFADALALDRFHLAGNSLGGRIAWNYALAYPEQVDKLVLIDAAGYPRPEPVNESLVFKLARTPIVNRIFTVVSPRRLIEVSLHEVYGDPSKIDDELIDRHFELSLRPGNRAAFVERALDARDDVDGDHRLIRQPTLILWGVEDRWIPLADGRGFADDIPNSRLIVYPGVGHVPMEEIPGPTARAALTFLRD